MRGACGALTAVVFRFDVCSAMALLHRQCTAAGMSMAKPTEEAESAVHLVALAGCDVIGRIVAGPFHEGEPGYHKRNDPDGDDMAQVSQRTGAQLQKTMIWPEFPAT